ncbi:MULTISPECIES: hypothetical protein [unclassified Gordonia (in: high G+C Gram-positive bacteria)]|uniref:hypothetical protein n=1 Tax=unclassified Gordonia (in: high G+C Gram-positive bacteria) TaxID=2657482 RepID=UPI001552981B|nr:MULTISPECIES: hypothetical protein [unclassified Gordonia (in: high G+C Gram-positive bacteria)]MDF3281603.1 hypothetical protein [Gordonia sp. N1V]
MTSRQDADGMMLRTVTLTEDGQLKIEGHDLGALRQQPRPRAVPHRQRHRGLVLESDR